MRAALRASGDEAAWLARLDHVNAHATSTPVGDSAELAAVGALAAGRPDGAPPLLVSATKGATGHLLGAAGALEAAFTVMAIAEQLAPPTLNLGAPEPPPRGVAHVTTADAHAGRELRAALCNSFGFGGVNASLLFGRWDE